MAFCSNCGERLEDEAKFCTKCGAAINAAQERALPTAEITTPGAFGGVTPDQIKANAMEGLADTVRQEMATSYRSETPVQEALQPPYIGAPGDHRYCPDCGKEIPPLNINYDRASAFCSCGWHGSVVQLRSAQPVMLSPSAKPKKPPLPVLIIAAVAVLIAVATVLFFTVGGGPYPRKMKAADVMIETARIWFEQENYGEAIKEYTRAINSIDNSFIHGVAYLERGIAYLEKGYASEQTGDFEKAIADFTKTIEMEPNNANAYGQRAVAYFMVHRVEECIEDANKALSLDPNNGPANMLYDIWKGN